MLRAAGLVPALASRRPRPGGSLDRCALWGGRKQICLFSVAQRGDGKPRGSPSVICDASGPLEHARNREEASYSRDIGEAVPLDNGR